MAKTESTMLELGTSLPAFSLPDTEGQTHSSKTLRGSKGTLVIFMCNHCPYVQHVAQELSRLGKELPGRGVAVVGINSNDIKAYPDDSPEKMKVTKKEWGLLFPYLLDETQAVAKSYRAACTPDFFLFDGQNRLVYRGQLDDSRPGNGVAVSGKDLRAAVESLLSGTSPSKDQRPSLGCNIKWKPGNAPTY